MGRGRAQANRKNRQPEIAILSVIQRIPRGQAMSYGDVAATAGYPRHARLVGRLLRELPPESDVPWHRVVNRQGRISDRNGGWMDEQRRRLESEGVAFDESGRIDLALYTPAPVKRLPRF